MSDRTIPFDESAICDNCGATGAFDFMGDLLCPKCASPAIDDDTAAALRVAGAGAEEALRDG